MSSSQGHQDYATHTTPNEDRQRQRWVGLPQRADRFIGQQPGKSAVGLGHTLQLVLLLNGIGVRGALGSIDELICQALSNGLNVPEGSLTSACAEQPDGLESEQGSG